MTEPTQTDAAVQEKLLPTDTVVNQVQVVDEGKEPTTATATATASTVEPATTKTPNKKKDSSVGAIIVAACCGSVAALGFLAILAAIPIIQTVIGWRYADRCPANWRIPHYSFIAGVVGLVTIGLMMIQAVLALVIATKVPKDEKSNVGGFVVATCGLCGISVVVIFLTIFLLGWFIAGCVWVFGAWNRVQYDDPDGTNYCHPTVYRVTFWLLLLSLIYQLYTCCRSSSQTAKQGKQAKAAKQSSAEGTVINSGSTV